MPEQNDNTIENLIEINDIDAESLPIEDVFNIIIKSKKLEEEYKLGKKLGSGGFGSVFKIDKNRAIKITDITEYSENYKEDFDNEKDMEDNFGLFGGGFAKTLKSYRVKVGDKYYLIEISKERLMDLRAIINQKENQENKEFEENNIERKNIIDNFSPIAAAIQLTTALEKAHLNGYVIADIKPDNVLINKDGICKLSDLGSVKNIKKPFKDKNDRTPGYRAPEEKLTEKADVYSLGITFSELFTYSNRIKPNLFFVDVLNITLSEINLSKLYPNIDFSKQPEVEKEIKERIYYLIKSMTEEDVNERPTIFEVKEKLAELTEYISQNLLNKDENKIDLKNDFNIRNKDLYNLGLMDKVDLTEIEEKYENELDLLINYNNKSDSERKEEKENNLHLKTVLGDEIDKFSNETMNCLNILKNYINKNSDIIIPKNFENELNKIQNEREKLIVSKRLLDLEKLQLARQENKIEEFKVRSLMSAIEKDQKAVEYLFNLKLPEKKLIDYVKKYFYGEKKFLFNKLFEKALETNNNFFINFLSNDTDGKKIIENAINSNNLQKYFLICCKNNDKQLINNLLSKNFELDKETIRKGTLIAIKNGNLELFKNLFEKIEIEKDESIFKEFINSIDKCANFEIIRTLLNDKFVKENKNLVNLAFDSIYKAGYLDYFKEFFKTEDIYKETIKNCVEYSRKYHKNCDGLKFLLENNFLKNYENLIEKENLIKEIFEIICEKENLNLFKELFEKIENGELLKIEQNEKRKKKINRIAFNDFKNKFNLKMIKYLLDKDFVKNNEDLIREIFNFICKEGDLDLAMKLIEKIENGELLQENNSKDVIKYFIDRMHNCNNINDKIIEFLVNKEYIKNDKELIGKVIFDSINKKNFDLAKKLTENIKIDKEMIKNNFKFYCYCYNIEQINFLLKNQAFNKNIEKEDLNFQYENCENKTISKTILYKILINKTNKENKINKETVQLLIENRANFGEKGFETNKKEFDNILFNLQNIANDCYKEETKNNLNQIIEELKTIEIPEQITIINKDNLSKINDILSKFSEELKNNNEKDLENVSNSINEITKIEIEEDKNLSNSLRDCGENKLFLNTNRKGK